MKSPRINIPRLLVIAMSVAGASLQFGCSSHRLRPGIWALSFHGQRVETRDEFPLDKREVKVLVEWKDSGDGEVVEISSLEDDLEPMYGDIRLNNENQAVLYIDHQDDDWHWRMYGKVRDKTAVMGEMFLASHRSVEDLRIEGRWDLQWLRDS